MNELQVDMETPSSSSQETASGETQEMGLMDKFRRAGFGSIGTMKGRIPVLEPYALLFVGIIASAYMTVRGAISRDSIGAILHGQSIMWIIFAVIAVVSAGAGFED